MRTAGGAMRAFLDGLTLAGFLGSARFPFGAQVLVEEEDRLEFSQFWPLVKPHLNVQRAAPRAAVATLRKNGFTQPNEELQNQDEHEHHTA